MNRLSLKELIEKLNQKLIPHRIDQSLGKFSSFKIGGLSPLIVEPTSTEMLLETLQFFNSLEIPFKMIGGGTNILISDDPSDFVVVKLSGKFKEFQNISDSGFYIGSAANTTPIFRNISLMGYTGLEFLSTIPGSVGGAVIQNAGCYGGELFDSIRYVDILQNDQLIRLNKEQIEYGYRRTQFLKNKDSIILGIEISARIGELEQIQKSLKEKLIKRKESQPENRKSAGSIFRNPKDLLNGKPIKSWQLIDKVNLRGYKKGDAEISQKHCNFIVNNGKAKASDVHYLIQLVQERVWKDFKIFLEKEIEYFGTIK